MMKKTLFGKLLAIAMIFAGFSLTSCDEKDNAIIDGKVYVKPEYQLVKGGAIIKGSSTADINRMLGRIRQDVSETAGETFTIKINAPALTTTLLENTISIPTAIGTDIVVEFTNAIATPDVPLNIESIGVADDADPEDSNNEVEIKFAAGTSDIDLELNMPKSTVTLKGATFNELVATTARNTLIIESGVTVNWLLSKDNSNVIVKKGGKVLGASTDDQLMVYKKGIRLDYVWNNEIPKEEEVTEDDYYLVQDARVLKREDGNLVSIRLIGSKDEEQENVPEIIISDGAYACVSNETYDGTKTQPTFVNITGEGNATIIPNGADWGDGPSLWYPSFLDLTWVINLTNVTVDYSKYLKMDTETWSDTYSITELKDYFTEISLPINSENCTFKAKRFHSSADRFSEDIVASTHKGCTFDNLESEELPLFITHYPGQSEKRKSFSIAFDACGFKQASFGTEYTGVEYKDFKGYMVFDNSKVGGKAITKDTEMIGYDIHPENCLTTYTIDGADYHPVYDTKSEKWVLKDANAK